MFRLLPLLGALPPTLPETFWRLPAPSTARSLPPQQFLVALINALIIETAMAESHKPPGSTDGPTSTPHPARLKYDYLRRGIELLHTAVLVIGIAIALDQTVRLRESIDTSTWSALSAQIIEVDKAFVSHPEIVPYIYEGVPISRDDVNYPRAYAMGVLTIDLMDSATVMGRHIDPEIFQPEAWDRYYEYQFKHSPIMCKIILEEAEIYGPEIVSIGRKHCTTSESRVVSPAEISSQQPAAVK